MLTKQFNQVLRGMVTGVSYTLKRIDGNTATVTSPATVSNNYSSYFTQTQVRIPSLMNTDRYSTTPTYSSTGGVVFGTGTAAPTEDDYKVTFKLMSTSAGVAVTRTVTQDGDKCTGIYTIVNNGTEDITITEVGLYGTAMYNTSNYYCYLVDRTLLDEPVTIKAGEIGKVVYTVNIL